MAAENSKSLLQHVPMSELPRGQGSDDPLMTGTENGNHGQSPNDTEKLHDVESPDNALEPREQGTSRAQWARHTDFLLACIGFAVGLGNIWRFPYLCYKNGGGAFLIPYCVCLVTCGVPIFLLEMALGQYMATGSVQAWARLTPSLAGIGVASFSVSLMMNVYYIMVLTWASFYLFLSLKSIGSSLPWATCDNDWNTPNCFSSALTLDNNSIGANITDSTENKVDSVVEFWNRRVLKLSSGIEDAGHVSLELAVTLLIVWVLVYFCVWRGVRWTGKVVYVTALLPFVMLTILVIRGVTLPGAGEGLIFYLKPNFGRLADSQVWIDGGTQIFFSYAIALGAITTLGSYNKFNNNVYRDCLIISSVNSFTSLYGGIAVFSVLGFMAHEQNVTVADVVQSGPGLVFLTYPKAVNQMPLPHLWAVLFFFMILLVGLDSQFVAVEGVLTPIFDMFPRKLYRMTSRMLLTAVYCACSFLLGLSMVTQGGMYVFQIFDFYSASGLVLLWICFWESVAVAWIFGATRFNDAIELMIGRRVPSWFVLCWRFFTPIVSMAILLFMVVKFRPLTYSDTYIYPDWAQALGLCMAGISMLMIPLAFLGQFLKTTGHPLKKLRIMCTPRLVERQIPAEWHKQQFNWRLIR